MIELAWIVGSVVMGWIANQRGRNGFGWFLLSLAVSPLLSAVFLIAAGAAVRPPVCVGPVVVPNRAPALTALGIVAAIVTIAVAAFIAFTGTPDVGGVSTVAKSPNWQDLFQPGEE